MLEKANELLDVVKKATGIFYPVTSSIKILSDNKNELRNLQSEYDKMLKKDIIENTNIDNVTKAALISNMTKSTMEFVNQAKILGVAIDNLSSNAEPEKLDNDWLFYFMHKAAYISDEQLRNTWGKILAEACENPRMCTKTLVNTLSLMNKKQAEIFKYICKFRFINMNIPAEENDRISVYPVIFFSKGLEGYANHGLTNRGLLELEHLGLIDIDSNKEFVVYTELLKLRDRKNSVEIIGNGKIEIGNIAFTYDGFLLQKIVDNYYDSQIMDYNIQIWCHKGYQVYRNGKKQNVD